MRILCGICTLAVSSIALAQDAPAPAKLSAAQVHASRPGVTDGGGYIAEGKAEFFAATMLDMISQAYGVEQIQVAGGPNWLDTDRFDVIAKADRITPTETMRSLMQGLLADRFKLAAHKEEKPLPVFLLTVSKRGLKVKESAEDGPSDCNGSRKGTNNANVMMTCKSMTMAEFGQNMRQAAGGYLNHPVVDQTKLTAKYNFTITWTGRGQLRPGEEESISFFDAAEKQLGLHFEQQNLPMPVIVIEKLERKPAEDPSDVTRKAEPTEFEVASVKPSAPDEKGMRVNITPGGQVELWNVTLEWVIKLAYEMDDRDEVANMPKWASSDRYDITAKTIPNVSFTATAEMVKNLLAERFGLKAHIENQPVDAFVLTLGKRTAKLKESDGSARSNCTPGSLDGKRTIACQNMPMDQIAVKLHQTAGGYFTHPVVDQTGLKGSYDLELTWSPIGRTRGAQGPIEAGSPSDPSGDITVFEALEKQLGIKVVQQKYPLPVLTIDHIERTPTTN